jgi:hypothetical protein
VGIRSVGRIEGDGKAVKFERFDAARELRTLLESQ